MKITYYENEEQMSRRAARFFLDQLNQKPDMLVCTASGNSPKRLYQILAKEYQKNSPLFSKLKILALDEWGGIPKNDPNSCRSFLEAHLIKPLNIPPDRFFAFDADSENPEQECARIQANLEREGPVDCSILGLGRNGHLGFNEPASYMNPECHVAALAEETLEHSMSISMTEAPIFGMTIGMKDIFRSNKIVLLVTGQKKQTVIRELLTKKITPELPASFLWLHPDVECMIDKKSSPDLTE